MTDRTVSLPPGPFTATATVPGDKSLSHRALILAAMAEGRSRIRDLGPGHDIASTASVLRSLGVELDGDALSSPGIGRWQQPGTDLDCGNSGTTMRLMAGALAGSGRTCTLVGDDSLMRRPMRRLVEPLQALGARIGVAPDGTPPVTVGSASLRGAEVQIPLPSAQVRTAVSFAALRADGTTTIASPSGFRDHTEHWLKALGLAERIDDVTVRILPGPVPPLDATIPGDPSSAAFLWAAAAVRPGSQISTPGVSLNRGRQGFLQILESMGATVRVDPTGDVMGDPVGDVSISAAPMRGVIVEGEVAAAAIDELPLVAIVAATARGTTIIRDASELRVKESDRLDASMALAEIAGGYTRALATGFEVTGGGRSGPDTIDSNGDHRIAMAAAIASMAAGRPVTIAGFDATDVSWPGFDTALEGLWS